MTTQKEWSEREEKAFQLGKTAERKKVLEDWIICLNKKTWKSRLR